MFCTLQACARSAAQLPHLTSTAVTARTEKPCFAVQHARLPHSLVIKSLLKSVPSCAFVGACV